MVRELSPAKIFFTDLSDYKLRPVLLIKEYKDEDFLYLPLTTNLELKGIGIVKKEIFGKVMKVFCTEFNCKEFA